MSSLNLNLHENNVYLGVKGVVDKFPERLEKGVAKITKFTFDSKEDILYNLRAVRNGRMFVMYDGKFVRLTVNGELMMSDTTMERISNLDFINNAKGRVMIAGLGIGLILEAILNKEEVSEVVVIEKYQDVIDLVEPIYQHRKLKIICADIFEYEMPSSEKFDVIYFDIWADISTSNLSEMKQLHNKYKINKRSKDSFMDSWLRDFLKQRLKEEDGNY